MLANKYRLKTLSLKPVKKFLRNKSEDVEVKLPKGAEEGTPLHDLACIRAFTNEDQAYAILLAVRRKEEELVGYLWDC